MKKCFNCGTCDGILAPYSDSYICLECITKEVYHPIRITKKKTEVVKPDYYNKGDVTCFDAIRAATIGLYPMETFYTGNAIKYLWRWKDKNKVEDLEKAKHYIDCLILEIRKQEYDLTKDANDVTLD